MTFTAYSNEDRNSLISPSHITIANAGKMKKMKKVGLYEPNGL